MTPPTEFNPTPEQVEQIAKRILEETRTTLVWGMINNHWKDDLRLYSRWHLTELHRETETLRSQVEALKAQVVAYEETKTYLVGYLTIHGAKDTAELIQFAFKQALTQLEAK